MKKFLLAAVCLMFIGTAWAGSCRNCGCNTYKKNVYQCKKCRRFFCDQCREEKEETNKKERSLAEEMVSPYAMAFQAITNGIDIICPCCGAEGNWHPNRGMRGDIRMIQRAR